MGKLRVLVTALLFALLFALPGCAYHEVSEKTAAYIKAGESADVLVLEQESSDTTLPEKTAGANPDTAEPDSEQPDSAQAEAALTGTEQPGQPDTEVPADETQQAALSMAEEASPQALAAAAADTKTSGLSDSSVITAADISALPAGTIVDDFLKSGDIVSGCFYSSDISDAIFARMNGKSYKEGCTVAIADLRYVRVLYYGFDSSVHIGELVVNKKIAQDAVDIFRGLYDARYPIGKMVLVDDYGADDNASMLDNNTSGFNYRVVNGTTTLSRHALGMAIDINPLYNPWIYTLKGTTVIDPPEAAKYADRTLDCAYYLDHEDLCCRLFIEHGFTWGGDWDTSKDYQHFSKDSKDS